MPNWCYTRMTITGSKEECIRFRDGVKVEEVEEKIYDYRKTPIEEIGTRMVKHLHILDAFYPCPQELYDMRSPVREEDEERANELMEKYGSTDWYSWQNKNWGTKWGDCHTELLDEGEFEDGTYILSYSFDTPWGTATSGFEYVSEQFPTLIFEFHYDEEAGFFQGNEVIYEGGVVYEGMFQPCEYPVPFPDEPEKEDEWNDNESKWRHHEQSKIDAITDAVVASLKK